MSFLTRALCALGIHAWPGRSFEMIDVFRVYGRFYLTAEQGCWRCRAKRTVRVYVGRKWPKQRGD